MTEGARPMSPSEPETAWMAHRDYEIGLLESQVVERNVLWAQLGELRARLKVTHASIKIVRKMIATEESRP